MHIEKGGKHYFVVHEKELQRMTIKEEISMTLWLLLGIPVGTFLILLAIIPSLLMIHWAVNSINDWR
jgi:hypothetical protein